VGGDDGAVHDDRDVSDVVTVGIASVDDDRRGRVGDLAGPLRAVLLDERPSTP
jgi:hypothetical protein